MYIGIDLGTSSLKSVLADENGKILDAKSVKYPLLLPKENWSEQRPSDWYNSMVESIGYLSEKYDLSKLKGISFSGQMHGMVCVDKDGKVIRNAILWNDQRTEEQTNYLNEVVGESSLIEWTGNRAVTGFTAPKVLWLKQNEPDNFNKIYKILMPKDYLVYKLTGKFATDVSDASGTLYFDVKNKKWSKQMLEVLGISEDKLPKVYESYEVISQILPEMSTILKICDKTKIIIGGGDQAVGAVGTGAVKNGDLSISLGTSGVVFASSDNFGDDKNGSLHSFCHANGNYHVMGVTLSAAGSLNWWMKDILNEKDFLDIDNILQNLPIDYLIFLPYLIGERSPINDSHAKGAFFGLNLSHKRENLIKAILEGVCFSLKDCLEVVKTMNINCKKAKIIGGGAKSKIWLQMLADVMNLEIVTVNTYDGAAFGSVILAMVGCGQYKDVKTACDSIIKEVDTYTPNPDAVKIYEKKFKSYKKLYFSTKNII